jgi:hypothetical protein
MAVARFQKHYELSVQWVVPDSSEQRVWRREGFEIALYLHVVHEEWMVRTSWYDPNFDLILRIPVQELIIDKDLMTHACP